MPEDARMAPGSCDATTDLYNFQPPTKRYFVPPMQDWMTGGPGAGEIDSAVTRTLSWPPETLMDGYIVRNLPQYAPTGRPITLPTPPTPTVIAAGVTLGDGWHNPSDGGVWYSKCLFCLMR